MLQDDFGCICSLPGRRDAVSVIVRWRYMRSLQLVVFASILVAVSLGYAVSGADAALPEHVSDVEQGIPERSHGGPEDPEPAIVPMLAWSFGSHGDFRSREDRFDWFRRVRLHWGAMPTYAVPRGLYQSWERYLSELIGSNPNALPLVYFSAVTTGSPTIALDPQWWPEGDMECPDPESGRHGWESVPDTDGFFSPAVSDNYPFIIRPGNRGYAPFEMFFSRGWIMPQMTYLCRAVLDFRRSEVQDFIADTLVIKTTVEYPLMRGVAADNAAMFPHPQYGHWPGSDNPGSPYYDPSHNPENAPTADFLNYLARVSEQLHEHEKVLIVNGTARNTALIPVVNGIIQEDGVTQAETPEETLQRLEDYRAWSNAGRLVSQRYGRRTGEPLLHERRALDYFVASSLMAGHLPQSGVLMELGDLTNDPLPPHLNLATWLGEPLGDFRAFPEEGIVSRSFANGLVAMNIAPDRAWLSDAVYDASGFSEANLPRSVPGKTAVVVVFECPAGQDGAACEEHFSIPVPIPGDANCDWELTTDDLTALALALNYPDQYRSLYAGCDRERLADVDGDGQLLPIPNSPDYTALHLRLTGQLPNHSGDANCDGTFNHFDIDAFLLALLDPRAYQKSINCHISVCDLDSDNSVTNFDLELFLARLAGR